MNRPRAKMSIENRAKQFAPFSPLKGLEEALLKKERVLVDKIEISEDREEEIARIINQISEGTEVKVVYFQNGEYLSIQGVTAKIDKAAGTITVVKNLIPMEDIYEIRTDV